MTPIAFADKTAHTHYQLLLTTCIRNVSGANGTQIAEVELLGAAAGGLAPEVDAGEDRTIAWRGSGNTIMQLHPVVRDDDPGDPAPANPDYLTVPWWSPRQPVADFTGTRDDADATVSLPDPGVHTLQLQV